MSRIYSRRLIAVEQLSFPSVAVELLMDLILSADDFGFSVDTVERTITCLEDGTLTSASIMAQMPATGAAAAYARTRPDLSFGAHLCYCTDDLERPLCDSVTLPTLTDDGSGSFLPSNTIRRRALLGLLAVDDIVRETEAQLGRLRDLGVPLCYVDAHGHLHKFSPFVQALRHVLPRFGIHKVRRVQNIYLRKPLKSPTFWLGSWWNRAIVRSFTTTAGFYMPASAGDRNWAAAALAVITAAGLPVVEVGCHPGHDEAWRRHDEDGMREFVRLARQTGHRLLGWADLT
jgi:chitin disaccharide deacetylase